ncbi:MAG: DEAD/DEAH box helicase [Phycisphaeraceae bacterium]
MAGEQTSKFTVSGAVTKAVLDISEQQLQSYRVNPRLVTEQAKFELARREGTYGRRQLYELIQNGADAMLGTSGGRIHVQLTETHLYCANEGAPVDTAGIEALLYSHMSSKRGHEIGRFGLGFKSVLGVSDRPEFHSRSGSFAFNADTAAKRIKEVVPDAKLFPTLRIATPIDSEELAAEDEVLESLMTWATTVIRLPRTRGDSQWLSDDIENFPAEFMLFCPQVSSLTLEDETTDFQRILKLTQNDKEQVLLLDDGGEQSEWMIFRHTHRPSEAAKKDAGELADRDEIPIHWAAPRTGRPGLGDLWAFFPLRETITLSGILNAPWKTNDDRSGLLLGKFNEELLEVAADLVARSFHKVATPDDPGRALAILSARGREARGWADKILGDHIYSCAASHPSIPDQTGKFRRPHEIKLHPEGLPVELLEAWSKCPTRPEDWAHPSVESRERRPRVLMLMDEIGFRASTLQQWLSALDVDSKSLESIKPCIKVAAVLSDMAAQGDYPGLRPHRDQLNSCEIVVDSRGALVCPDPDEIFLPGDHDIVCTQIELVHHTLYNDEEIYDCLTRLGLRQLTPELELEALLLQLNDSSTIGDWEAMWKLVRLVEQENAIRLLRGRQIRIRNVEGDFIPARFALLPGNIVPADGSRDADVAVDIDYHAQETGVLSQIGLAAEPQPGCKLREEIYRGYEYEMTKRYLDSRGSQPKPQMGYLVFDNSSYIGPLESFPKLSDEGKAEFIESLIAQGAHKSQWVMRHKSNKNYPAKTFESPEVRLILNQGVIKTSLGLYPHGDCVGPALKKWGRFFPVVTFKDSDAAEALGICNNAKTLEQAHWEVAYGRAEEIAADDLLGDFYAFACKSSDDWVPANIHCRIEQGHDRLPPEDVTVTAARNEFEALADAGTPCLLVSNRSDAAMLVEEWGLQPSEQKVQTSISKIVTSDPIPLLDRFPALGFHAPDPDKLVAIEVVECSDLREETITDSGKRSRPQNFVKQGNRILWLSDLGVENLLERIDERLGLELGPEVREEILGQHAEQERQSRLLDIRSQPSDEHRLLACIGSKNVLKHLPVGLIRAVEAEHGGLDDLQIANLALTVYGSDTLIEYKDELGSSGLMPPQTWAGSRNAIKFVRSLGFDRKYAGYRGASRPPSLIIDGPMLLNELHPYQREAANEIHHLAVGDVEDRRGLLSLPTGAGKTRVAVQSIVELLRDGHLTGPALWVAQSDELCEQAVQTWREVWRAMGGAYELNIGRLWANNDVVEIDDGAQVVVATIQKLGNCIDTTEYEWLQNASILVIDEAHTATTPAYTQLLRWQSIGRRGTGCPLLGLTATPFRGHSVEQTKALVARFGHTRLDRGLGEEPYARLQELGVLSQVEHKLLAGTSVTLESTELAELQKYKSLPSSVYARLATDTARNRTLLEDILQLPKDWPVLLFCASVEHAQTMAALLRMADRTAAPVSGETAPGVRRDVIEKFRKGEIQILTNCDVLTQGFDAPAVRVIYVARPTFSPNRYQQMIGRGLRGPLNGGKEVCRIVNIEDTFAQHGDALAFQGFEYLWNQRPD